MCENPATTIVENFSTIKDHRMKGKIRHKPYAGTHTKRMKAGWNNEYLVKILHNRRIERRMKIREKMNVERPSSRDNNNRNYFDSSYKTAERSDSVKLNSAFRI